MPIPISFNMTVPQAFTGFNAFLKIFKLRFGQLVDHIGRSQNAQVACLTGAALTPAQSQSTDMLRSTLI